MTLIEASPALKLAHVSLGPNGEIRGSTTIVELLRRYPNGEAARLMSRLHWPCAHCGGAFHEPLTLAAKRHKRDPRAVIDAFRALDNGGPTPEQVDAASRRVLPL